MSSGDAGQAAAPRRVIVTPGIAAVAFAVLAILLAGRVADLLLLLFLAILIAVYLSTFTDLIVARTRWQRPIALTGAIIGSLLVLWGIEALLVPPVVAQTRALIAGLPRYIAAWQEWVAATVIRFPALEPVIGGERQGEIVDRVVSQAESFVSGVFPRVVNVVHGLINVAAVAVMSIYLARTPTLYTDLIVALTPPAHRGTARDVLVGCGVALRQWVFAQLFNMSVLGALTAVGLWALDVPYWLAFGIFAGLAAIVPFFGTLVSTILPALFVLDRGVTAVVLVIALGVIVHVVEGNVVAPMIFQRGIKLPPVLTIMAVLIVGSLLGPVGLIVAVPLLAVTMVIVREVLQERVYHDPSGPPDVVAAARTSGEYRVTPPAS